MTNAITEQIAKTRLAIELAEPRVAAALAVQQQANEAIDSTDDHAAEALAELLVDYQHVLGLSNHSIVVRKRPGTSVPETLPQICVSQQVNSLDDGGIFSVDRLVITAYAASAGELTRLDTGTLLGLMNGAPEQMAAINAHGIRSAGTLGHFCAAGIGNTAAVETLEDGAVRKQYVIDEFAGNLRTPRVLAPLTPSRAQSMGNDIARQSTKIINIPLTAIAVPESGTVIQDGPTRVIEVAVEIGTRGAVSGWNGERLGGLISSACPAVGSVLSGFGRVTHTEIVKTSKLTNTSGCFTVKLHAEALVA